MSIKVPRQRGTPSGLGKREGECVAGQRASTRSLRPTQSQFANDMGLARLRSSTLGSTGVDVPTATEVNITDTKVQKVPLSLKGPLGNGFSALLLGRTSVTLQGLFVLPAVIDADFEGQIQAMAWTLSPPVTVPAGERICQLVLFHAHTVNAPSEENRRRGTGGFGPTGK
uniref:dUTPase-like domain-containing protein n=1 Tax=Amazona collaria TaxID=241587 RepID=A0A8B9G862_9PSIT